MHDADQASTDQPTRGQWITLFVMSMALMIVIIDVTIVNVTIPAMQFDFGASLQNVEWVSALYALVYASLIITFGKLGDTYGRRRLFNMGLGVFVAGSLLVGAAPSIGWVLVGRFIQALGAAMVSPSTLSIVSSTFRGRSRGIAFGIWGGTAAAAGAIGPLLGGFLTTYVSWRWAFLINLPVGILAVAGSMRYVPEFSIRHPDARWTPWESCWRPSGWARWFLGSLKARATAGWYLANHSLWAG